MILISCLGGFPILCNHLRVHVSLEPEHVFPHPQSLLPAEALGEVRQLVQLLLQRLRVLKLATSQHSVLDSGTSRLAETPKCWNKEFQIDSNKGQIIKLQI